MSSKKVGVITFHDYDNYGAVLQSYALQQCLKRLGAEPEVIDYKCEYISNPFQLKRLKNKGLFNYIYGAVGYVCYLPRRVKFNKFRKNISYGKPVNSKTIGSIDGEYDIFITGSDQVWDYHLTDFDKAYFLDFVTKGKKCSYAASIGEHLPEGNYREQYAELLEKFDHILMREEYGAEVVQQLIDEKPECACDPTLLLTGEEWEKLMPPSTAKKDYILVYQLGINPSFVNFVKRLKEKTGLNVVYVPFPLVGLVGCAPQISAGPEEWLRFFKDAKYVVTDSFHGTVFSLLFHKPFFVKVDGHHVNKRVKEFLTRLGLTERIIQGDLTDEALAQEIDYERVDKMLQDIREDSMKKLLEIIS